ncbi:hypothetical protein GCM10009737_24560 [Nocardioides lentus]|uniref:SPOR domain-containing protein n=1 Tax=Nocardioides lentus TaxID=338077 RepID=A0ABP5ATH2_9ACTN
MKRLISGLVATAVIGFTPVALGAPAVAAEVVPQAVEQPAAAERAPSFEAKRKVSMYLNEPRANRFVVSGLAKPNYKNSTVIIKRAVGENNNNYKIFKKVKTNGQGKYRTNVSNPSRVGQVVKYFALVKKRGDYSAARSSVRGIRRIS